MIEISHSCVFDVESEELDIVKIDQFCNFHPKTFKDFNQYEIYIVQNGPRNFMDVEILALGGILVTQLLSYYNYKCFFFIGNVI